jgi:hypothetical protein
MALSVGKGWYAEAIPVVISKTGSNNENFIMVPPFGCPYSISMQISYPAEEARRDPAQIIVLKEVRPFK